MVGVNNLVAYLQQCFSYFNQFLYAKLFHSIVKGKKRRKGFPK